MAAVEEDKENYFDDAVILYTVQDVAKLVQVSAATVRSWLGDNKIPGIKLDAGWRVRRVDLIQFLTERYTSSE